MTIKYLLDALIKDFKEEFEGYKLINQNNRMVDINVYPYNLPEKKTEDDEAHFPFFLVKPATGKAIQDEESVVIAFVIGVHDDNENKQGFAEILNIIEKYKNHLMYQKYIGGFELIYPLEWAMQEDDEHPFYYAGIETNWKIRKMSQKEDEYI
jgi:hypothetical protein